MASLDFTERSARPLHPVAVLRARRAEIYERFAVRHLGVFGSYARGDATPASDLDVLVEFAPGEASYDRLFDLHAFLSELFGGDIDVVPADGLSAHVRPYVEEDLIWI